LPIDVMCLLPTTNQLLCRPDHAFTRPLWQVLCVHNYFFRL